MAGCDIPNYRIFKKVPMGTGGNYGERTPLQYVKEVGSRYRFGGAYVSYGNMRLGLNSDRYIRHGIQDIFAHYFISPQPGFEVLSNSILPYVQYQTKNQFTSW